jgi:hypothetical protein
MGKIILWPTVGGKISRGEKAVGKNSSEKKRRRKSGSI